MDSLDPTVKTTLSAIGSPAFAVMMEFVNTSVSKKQACARATKTVDTLVIFVLLELRQVCHSTVDGAFAPLLLSMFILVFINCLRSCRSTTDGLREE